MIGFICFLLGLIVGVFAYIAFVSFMLSRGRVPSGLKGIVELTPEFKARLKRGLGK